ncbi:MAG: DUF1565 domain-containing protein, partial [Butyrivibrio sp.]|nr:DUF1565 domain-containing protein [Butyrivibrio sp.]
MRNFFTTFKYALITAFCLCLFIKFDCSAYAADWYISPSGNDSNAGTSTSAPFKSLMRAQDAASSGDTVYIMGGTYNDFGIAAKDNNYNYVNEFTKSNITYRAYTSKDVPVFD